MCGRDKIIGSAPIEMKRKKRERKSENLIKFVELFSAGSPLKTRFTRREKKEKSFAFREAVAWSVRLDFRSGRALSQLSEGKKVFL